MSNVCPLFPSMMSYLNEWNERHARNEDVEGLDGVCVCEKKKNVRICKSEGPSVTE